MSEALPERNVTALIESYRAAEPARFQPICPDPAGDPSATPLTHYLWILKRQRWKIVSFILASVIATFIVSSRLEPVYESTATVDVDRQMPTGVIGQDSMRSTTNDAEQFLATQVRLIQSDS